MTRTKCVRCERPCQTGTPDPEARPFRQCTDKGLCPDCVMTHFLKSLSLEMGGLVIDAQSEILLTNAGQGIVRQLGEVMAVGGSQMRLQEVNWRTVVEHWQLPFPQGFEPQGA